MRSTIPFKSLTSLTYIIAILGSIFFIITFNYFALKTLNGVRSFISGESQFAKGQLEASRYIILYIHSGQDKYFELYEKSLQVPISDSLARINMDNGGPDSITTRLLFQGKNDAQDIPEIIWLYKNFKAFKPFQKSINIWIKADLKIMELQKFADAVYPLIKSKQITNVQRQLFEAKVNAISEQLVLMGNDFEDTLGNNIRFINSYALWIINSIALLIIAGNIYYFYRQIHLLSVIKEKTQIQNKILRQLNSEMDLFTYSVSHDLRSPITSLKGLVNLAQAENQSPELNQYFQFMQMTLDRQDLFIQNIINLTKHKRTQNEIGEVNLEDVFDQILTDIGHMVDKSKVNIYKDLNVKRLHTDRFRLKIILNNLLSNAFKYSDPEKPILTIGITSEKVENTIKIMVQDNGLGIKPEHHHKIFDMFYVVNHQSKGTGLGLYLVKETIQALGGSVEMNSEVGFGTSFTIYLPIVEQGE
ncbi:MAG: HAMP domain-containing histidine kinase [Pedobacter sp.]|nr:MAG: HAMP domain-containing histidine kinase [Pedobacter sp.]